MTSVYLQPKGWLYGKDGLEAQESGHALSIAGQETSFSLVSIIEREGIGKTHKLHALSDLLKSKDGFIQKQLKVLSAKRAKIANLSFDDNPLIMGVLNVTPDSFSDGGDFNTIQRAVAQGLKMREQGADIIDIGGESTRPGADYVSTEVEIERVMPALEVLSKKAVCSIDSRRASVMQTALEQGATLINDVTALTYDPESINLVSQSGAPVILMHSRISPQDEAQDMQQNPSFRNIALDIYDYLAARISACVEAGISADRIIVDPGIGFGKTFEDNMDLLKNIGLFHGLGVPILVGLSRKRFIGVITGEEMPQKRDPSSLSLSLAMIRQGVQIVRVHNVADMKQVLRCFVKTR